MSAKLPTSNAKTAYGLLSEVRRLILAEPKRYNQRVYLLRRRDIDPDVMPACGTIGCVAGWVATLTRGSRCSLHNAGTIAQQALGIDDELAEELFFYNAVEGVPHTRAHAEAGAQHIARFQQKYAKQLKAKAL